MPNYRAYVLGQDNHITDRVDLVCVDDEAAKNEATQLVDGHAIELWDGARKIATFEPPDQASGKTAQMPFMITKAQKQQLREIGHDDSAISNMTPAQALQAIAGHPWNAK